MASLSGQVNYQELSDLGILAAGFRLYTYLPGTTTHTNIYTDAAGAVPHTYTNDGAGGQYIGLDARGEVPGSIYVSSGGVDLALKTVAGATVWTRRAIGQADAAAAVDALIREDLSNDTGATLVGFKYGLNYAVGTLGWSIAKTCGIDITQSPYLADSTGTTDSAAAIAAAYAANPGIPLWCPPGTYRVDSTPALSTTTFVGVFGAGAKIYGAGPGVTIFDNRVANGALFDISSNTSSKYAFGPVLDGFSIKTTTSPASSVGIKFSAVYNATVRNVRIDGMTSHGLEIPVLAGDADASNMPRLEHVRIENCLGWGIKADGASGHNELSFLYMSHVFVQACGTTSGSATPPSGGMIWKGQILVAQACAFVINENVGLFIPGQSGAANTVDLQNTTFENNKKRHLYCTGLSAFKARNMQLYSNNSFVATNGVEFDGASFAVRNVDINGVLVRATSSNNPYIAFKISGSNAELDTCRVRGVSWDDFDYTGQTRFSGFQFDRVGQDCDLVTLSTTSTVLRPSTNIPRGNKTPLRLRGGGGGTPSTTGEWIAHEIVSSGISISNASLTNSTRYYCYLYDNSGVAALELSTTVAVQDTDSGYFVKTGDATHLYVGSVMTDGSSLFATANTGWLNPTPIAGSQTGTYAWMWYSGTSAALRRTTVSLPTSDTDGALV